jgi:hypothetical protein
MLPVSREAITAKPEEKSLESKSFGFPRGGKENVG